MEASAGCTSKTFYDVPIGALNISCRRKLAMGLNPELPLPAEDNFMRDWRGLAELLDFEYDAIMFLRECPDPTTRLLDMWQNQSDATVDRLLECLQRMERFDVTDDIIPLIERDVKAHNKRLLEKRQTLEAQRPIQEPLVSSRAESMSITVADVDAVNGKVQTYDAYVCYADADSDFVIELIKRLEGEYGLKLFVKDRDLLPGNIESDSDIQLIQDRCRRILVVLSPAFIQSPVGEFQTMFAHAVSVETSNVNTRKIIPIIYRPCAVIPSRLKFLARLDYTKGDLFGSFWIRLYNSIKDPMHSATSAVVPSSANRSSSVSDPSASSAPHDTSSLSSGIVSDFPSSVACSSLAMDTSENSNNRVSAAPSRSSLSALLVPVKADSNSKSPKHKKRNPFNWGSSTSHN